MSARGLGQRCGGGADPRGGAVACAVLAALLALAPGAASAQPAEFQDVPVTTGDPGGEAAAEPSTPFEVRLPHRSPEVHEGVGSCAGSTCHQVAFQTFEDQDVHGNAYAVLLEPASRRIARNLGLRTEAHRAPLCLGCHADFVPAEQRGEHFKLSDGVGCEACHGGAGRWLESHTVDASESELLSLGMYPTEDPRKRAELCVSCHLGTRDRFVTHEIMGAGHPRMIFELDAFTNDQPAHHDLSADGPPVQRWAIGQAVLAREMLVALADPKRGRDGIWPEFVLFDCHACHHPMSQRNFEKRPEVGLTQPGIAHFNDSSLVMLRHALAGVDPSLAGQLRRGTRDLHASVMTGGARSQARRLRRVVERGLDAVENWTPDVASVRRIARSLTQDGIQGQYRDYAEAEQTWLVLVSLVETLAGMGGLSVANANAIQDEAVRMLECMKPLSAEDRRNTKIPARQRECRSEGFAPENVPPALQRIEARLR